MTIDLTAVCFISNPRLGLSNVRSGPTGHRVHASTFGYACGYRLFGLCNSTARVLPATTFTADPVDCTRCRARMRQAGPTDSMVSVDVSVRKVALWAAWERHLLRPFGRIGFGDPARHELAGQRLLLARLIDTCCDRGEDVDSLTDLIIETGEIFARRLLPPDLAA